MQNPVVLAWLYLIVGAAGIVGGVLFGSIDLGRGATSWLWFDAVLLAMGGFGVVQGSRRLIEHRKAQK